MDFLANNGVLANYKDIFSGMDKMAILRMVILEVDFASPANPTRLIGEYNAICAFNEYIYPHDDKLVKQVVVHSIDHEQ